MTTMAIGAAVHKRAGAGGIDSAGALVVRRVRALGAGPRAAEKVSRYGSLWLALYACAWLLGAGARPARALPERPCRRRP